MIEHRAKILASIAVTAIVVGGLLHAFGSGAAGGRGLGWRCRAAGGRARVRGRPQHARRASLGVDTIALVAMVGALALGEPLAGAVIGLMFSGGAALESVASRRGGRGGS